MKIKTLLLSLMLLSTSVILRADEGMWLINMIEKGLAVKMQEKGLKLDPNVLYDENAVSISDAVVSLAFSCTGSMISNDGLMITNHHCAYSDVHALSTPEHNYLEDGFWAMDRSKELPVKREGIFYLKKVIDVTTEVQALKDSLHPEGKVFGMRKVYSIIETKYQKMYEGQGEVSCASMWSGNKYYMALYAIYKDVRLVAAPPVSIASYGGEVDNWEWPQHKGDFAIYRIYTAPDGSPAEYSPDNIPMKPKNILKVSTEGFKPGDFTMVIGYPGRTDRYASSFGVTNIEKLANPIEASLGKGQMQIIDGWMNSDPNIRLKYADYYFSLTNVQEIREGEIYCYNRFKVAQIKKEQEKQMQAWIMSDTTRADKWGNLMTLLEQKYRDVAPIEKQIGYYRGTLVRGVRFHSILNQTERFARDIDRKGNTSFVLADNENYLELINDAYANIDVRVEKDLTSYAFREFFANVDSAFWGKYLCELYDRMGGDTEKINNYVWDNSIFGSEEVLMRYVTQNHTLAEYQADPMIMVGWSTKMLGLNQQKAKMEKGTTVSQLEKQYRDVLYFMRKDQGIPQYPDANSTMRLTYGTVCDLQPIDGVTVKDHTTPKGILEKYDPDRYIYTLKPELKRLYESKNWGRWVDAATGELHVNFLTDNDITGGNSGSPVLNANGELIGLAFDGNKESLAGDTYFDPAMNRCVCVDIRYVMWILDKYAGMNYIVEEILGQK